MQQRFDAIDFSKFATNDALAAAIDGLKSTYVTKSDLNSELAKYASQDDLKNVQDQIDAIIRDYAKKTDVDKVQTALDAYKQSVDAVLGGLDGKSVAEYVAAQMAILNGRIETVEGNITIINGQIETINGNIETVNRRIEALEGISFASTEDLAQAVTKLEGAIAACVKSEDLPGILEDYATKTWVEEAIEAYIEAALNDQIAKAIDTKIADAEKTIKEDVLVLVGDQFGSYMSEYLSDTESVKELLGVTSGDVLKQMQDSDSEFAKAIIKLANDSMGEDINTAKIDIEDIKKQLAAHEERLNGLDEVVSALKGRIQAIVNVPMNSNGQTVVDNYRINGKYLWGDKVSAVLTYHVAPAVKVAQIVKAYNEKDANWAFSILDEELTRAAQTTILGMEEVDGKLAVKVSIPNNDGKKHALALQVDYKTVNETGEELDDATAISNFACIYKKNVNCEIQLGAFADDGKFTEATGAVSHELEYTSKEPVSVKMDYAVYDTYNKKYMTIEEVNKMIKEAEGSEEDVLSVDYTVEPQFAGEEDPLRKAFVYDEEKLEVTLGEEANLNIGKTLTLKAAAAVNLNGEELSPITKDIDVTIIGKNGGDIIVNDMTMPWTYEAATGSIDFDAAPYNAVFATDYAAAEGNPTLAEILAGTCTSSEVMNAKDEAVTGAAIELTGAEGGLRIQNISGITEFWGSTFTFVNVYQYKNDSHEIVYRVKGKIAFAAKPALPHGKNPEPIEMDITSAAENVVEAVDWAKIMEVEGFDAANYGGLDNFIAGIKAKSVKKYLNDKENEELTSAAGVTEITIDPADVARNRDCVKMEVEYVYVEGEVETPIAEITVAATVKLDGYAIVSNSHYVDNNKVNVQATMGGNGYWAWNEANLNNYFTYTRPEAATEEMLFSVTTAEGEAEGKVAATLTADNKLDFTNATTRKASVQAEVTVGHIVVAEHDIEVTANALLKEMTVKPANWTYAIGETHDFDLRNCVEVIDVKGNCYNAENGEVTRIPDATVTFAIPENDQYFEKVNDYTVKFKSANNAQLLKPITIEVTAVYADKFETTEKKITITVNPAN